MSTLTQTPHPHSGGANAGGKKPTNAVSTSAAVGLVAEREITSQIRSKAFLISTAITLLLILGGIILSSVLGGGEDEEATDTVALVGTSEMVAGSSLEVRDVGSRAEAEELLRSGEVDAVVLADNSPAGVTVLGLEEVPGGVIGTLTVQPEIELLEPPTGNEGLRAIVGIAFGVAFMVTALGSGAMIVQNTVQEKQSRVVEILLAAVPARVLLAGKILGNWVIGVGTAAAMAAAAALGLAVTGQGELLAMLTAPMLWFVLFFLVGFVLIASIFAAGGALVSRQEDTGTVMQPAMMLVILPYFGVVFFADNPLVMTILSYVPFSAPVGMPLRLFFGDAAWWEPLISLVILVVTAWLVSLVAARMYENSLLKMGSRVSLREALKRS